MSEEPIMCLDVGTHAVKAALVNAQNGVLELLEEEPIALDRIDAVHIEQDAMAIVNALQNCIHKVLNRCENPPLKASLACQRSTVLAWDKNSLKPLGPALSWQDTRGQTQLKQLSNSAQIHQKSGLALSAHYGATKLHWLQAHYLLQPDQHRMGPLASYLLCHLLDNPRAVCDSSNASRTQLLNIHNRCWDTDLLELFSVDAGLLPELCPTQFNFGTLKGTGVSLMSVCGDQNAALLSCISPTDDKTLVINIGTGAFALRPIAPKPLVKDAKDEGPADTHPLLTSLIMNNEHDAFFAMEGTVNGAGAAFSDFCKQAALHELGGEAFLFEHLDEWLTAGFDQPCVYINSIGGLGSPYWKAGPPPHFQALKAGTKPSVKDQAIAVTESIVFLLVSNVVRMTNNKPVERVLVGGGLSRIDGLCQRLADFIARPIDRLSQHEATLVGAAMALQPANYLRKPRVQKTFYPQNNPGLQTRYTVFEQALA